jgi:hypothetical protein
LSTINFSTVQQYFTNCVIHDATSSAGCFGFFDGVFEQLNSAACRDDVTVDLLVAARAQALGWIEYSVALKVNYQNHTANHLQVPVYDIITI